MLTKNSCRKHKISNRILHTMEHEKKNLDEEIMKKKQKQKNEGENRISSLNSN